MEGQPKSPTEKARIENHDESVESLKETIEHAQELMAELHTFNNVEVFGGNAMELNARAEELAVELKATLEKIPAKDCIENGLPYHPSDVKPESVQTPFPTASESGYAHTLDYVHAANDPNAPRVDQQQEAA